MKEVFAKRLKSARVLAALSQDQLVKDMGNIVTKNAISKYEKGEMMADGKILLALAKALKVKPDYFFRPYTVEIEKVEFRKKKRLSVKEVNSIKQNVTDFVERYLEVEQFLNISTSFSNPVANLSINNLDDIEKAALQVRKKWHLGLNALPNVIDLLEDNEIKVIEVDANEDFDGFSGWADGKIPIIVINKNYNAERKRLTALHELGHLILKLPDDLSEKQVEKKCFQFAGAMLLPELTFKSEIGNIRSHLALPELIAIKETYGISIQAIMARAKDLGIINLPRFINFRKWINNNRSEKDLGFYGGIERAFRFKQLIYRAASEEVISLSKAANLSNQKLAEFRKEFIAV
ncbi:ImmA/IrrE family metallo-endopeptidase [Marinilabilia salmonicolor]|uniref:Zn-dependent peptidase ImmA (M78 family) n=1 Tax=Marinilabilia salmonicolor TaxID=989 RepID=A0A368UYS2_9BACT|nr:XRE family transcriptional regulator [Marinilabilia salmonicolor]RCW31941.1 Zn-dependent peptidase ImmA (M78 family) [Marinilabilia salmonicolor]